MLQGMEIMQEKRDLQAKKYGNKSTKQINLKAVLKANVKIGFVLY